LIGDFGLSRHRMEAPKQETCNKIRLPTKPRLEDSHISFESLTGGVGTTFYRAPEQESNRAHSEKDKRPYDEKVDIFSFGIVLFEIFHPPFSTYMERADILTQLRGEKVSIKKQECWEEEARARFPETFCQNAPENVQKLIIKCLERSPSKRPSAKALLMSDLIPVRLELEQHYNSLEQIVKAIFDQPICKQVEVTYDTDAAVKANQLVSQNNSKKKIERLSSSAMSALAMTAAVTSFKQWNNNFWKDKKNQGAVSRAASVIAMNAATSAAITGSNEGFQSHVIEKICQRLVSIFQIHGAIHLKTPLLRPKCIVDSNYSSNSITLIDKKGNVLMLPDDLTVNFARAVSRGGAATVSFKRYDIDKVFFPCIAGGHPVEVLEASFDIVFEDKKVTLGNIEAEVIMVLCQSIASITHATSSTPFWYLRLTHTKLTDSILDLCTVPLNENIRKQALNILTKFSSCPPGKYKIKKKDDSFMQFLTKAMQDFPAEASTRLKTFLEDCLPLPYKIDESLDVLQEALNKLKLLDLQSSIDAKRLKHYKDVAKHLACLRRFSQSLKAIVVCDSNFIQPEYICVDLGLRQQQRHMHGQLFFQAFVLPDDYFHDTSKIYFEENEKLLKTSIKVAEGGRFDELIRKFRPPGNFGSIQFEHYTPAPIPVAVGIRFFVNNLAERFFFNSRRTQRNASDVIQNILGHPIRSLNMVRCVVVSVNGMDSSCLGERALVSSRLWAAGISTEYLSQSGVFMKLLNQPSGDFSNDWSLERVCRVCGILNIPFVIIVQPHLLKDKGAVRLRIISLRSLGVSFSEEFVPLISLAATVKKHSIAIPFIEEDDSDDEISSTIDRHTISSKEQPPSKTLASLSSQFDCIYVDSDQYYGVEKLIKGDKAEYKTISKSLKATRQKAEAFLNDLSRPHSNRRTQTFVIAIDLPLKVLRDFGTWILNHGTSKAYFSSNELTNKFPKHKKVFKTLYLAIQNLTRKRIRSSSKGDSDDEEKNDFLIHCFLYSTPDERYDFITLDKTHYT